MRPVHVHNIETSVPPNAYLQSFLSEKMRAWTGGEKERRVIGRIYRNSGIETRHSVLSDFLPDKSQALFREDSDGKISEPGTKERNDRFAVESRKLAVEVARRALENCEGISAADVTHVITASCTGFCNPGPDYFVVTDLGLKSSTLRYALGFMGCYAAVPALRMARDFCLADPSSVVLIVCVELCTLHLHLEATVDSLLANSVFSDGAAAAVVSARAPAEGRQALRLDGFGSSVIPAKESDMAWRIGDNGFTIALSAYVPDLIGANIRALIAPILADKGLDMADIGLWAVHPGGKAILDKIERQLGLKPEGLMASRDVLRRYGNMSSATILFVLKELLRQCGGSAPEDDRICAMAFGPGLTVESAVLSRSGTVAGI